MSVIDDYFLKLGAAQTAELERVRSIVKQVAPEAEEVITYGMPGFKYKKKYLIGFAAFKDHLSIFPTAAPVEAMKEKLTTFKLSRGTIQFTVENPVPEQVIKALVAIRIDQITG